MEVEKTGAVTSKEGYDLEGKKFCKENFQFLENYGLPTPPPPPPPPPQEKDAL